MRDALRLGFLGFGNMGRAMAAGIKRSGLPVRMFACAAHFEKLQAACAPLGVTPCQSAQQVVRESEILIAAVKPYQMEAVLSPLKELLAGKVLLSVASGWDFARLEALLGEKVMHISAMPNTPVAVGEGVVLLEEEHSLSLQRMEELFELLSPLGLVQMLPGAQKDTAGILTGCGPAWAAMFLEALGDAAVAHGLPRELSYTLAAQMLAGTAKLQLETGEHPAAMKDAVCSPGGTTIAGVRALEQHGFRAAAIAAVDAVVEKKMRN